MTVRPLYARVENPSGAFRHLTAGTRVAATLANADHEARVELDREGRLTISVGVGPPDMVVVFCGDLAQLVSRRGEDEEVAAP